jgi:transposase InsO family protein
MLPIRPYSASNLVWASLAHWLPLLTDNGAAFRSHDFARACKVLRVKHRFAQAYRPQTNGKAERFIQSDLARVGLRLDLPELQPSNRCARPFAASLQLPFVLIAVLEVEPNVATQSLR